VDLKVGRGTAVFSLAASLAAGGCLFYDLSWREGLPLWSYFLFVAAVSGACVSVWMLATGELPRRDVPDTVASRLRLLHPAVFFGRSWRELNREARESGEAGRVGHEVIVVFVTAGFALTLVEYYGDRGTLSILFPELLGGKYNDLVIFGWWSLTRLAAYALVPAVAIVLTPGLRFRDCGLRFGGFFRHLWIYAVLFAIVLPVVAFVSFKQDFNTYYPFYDYASRSVFDFLAWEFFYAVQFVSLEFFFRGFMLHPVRKYMGAYAILAMVIPYCMIHYGKPYLEPNAAIVAGFVLGTLSLRTGSIWCGCLIHITVAVSMDIAALLHAGTFVDLVLRHNFF